MINYWNKLQESYTTNPVNANLQKYVSFTVAGIDTVANQATLRRALPEGMPQARAFVTDFRGRVAFSSHGDSTTVLSFNATGRVVYRNCIDSGHGEGDV